MAFLSLHGNSRIVRRSMSPLPAASFLVHVFLRHARIIYATEEVFFKPNNIELQTYITELFVPSTAQAYISGANNIDHGRQEFPELYSLKTNARGMNLSCHEHRIRTVLVGMNMQKG